MCCIYPSFKLYQQSLPLPRIASPHYPCSLRKDLPLERREQILLVVSHHCRRPPKALVCGYVPSSLAHWKETFPLTKNPTIHQSITMFTNLLLTMLWCWGTRGCPTRKLFLRHSLFEMPNPIPIHNPTPNIKHNIKAPITMPTQQGKLLGLNCSNSLW